MHLLFIYIARNEDLEVLAAVELTVKAIQGSLQHRNFLGNDKTIKNVNRSAYVNSVLIFLHIHAILIKLSNILLL
jgi:hypothetical protein